MRLLLPFSANVVTWTFVAALVVALGRAATPAFGNAPCRDGAPDKVSTHSEARRLLALGVPFTEANAVEGSGRRDSARPRTARHRITPAAAPNAQASSRARATNVERLYFLPTLAHVRSGVLTAGHTSLPPPSPDLV
jgi:hypothetical protein